MAYLYALISPDYNQGQVEIPVYLIALFYVIIFRKNHHAFSKKTLLPSGLIQDKIKKQTNENSKHILELLPKSLSSSFRTIARGTVNSMCLC